MPTPSKPSDRPLADQVSPTGRHWMLGHGTQRVVVTEVGATMRTYTADGIDVLDGFAPDEWAPSGRGQVLAPWPNRLGDGRYRFGSVNAQAAIDDPEHGCAIHGLVRWLPWQPEAFAQNVVALSCPVRPTPSYPFRLDLRIEYRLGRDGLVITTTARNPGSVAAVPFGLGFHPYLSAGNDRVDTAVLTVPATKRLVLDGRSLPTGETQLVAGTEYDFTAARSVGATRMDTAFSDLVRDSTGVAHAHVTDPASGRDVELWADASFGYLMVYTGDTLPDEERRRGSIAIEPMTCPPDAFRTGSDVIVIEPGAEWQGRWGIRPT